MARETKIGLLVGMGFIVCFAIILSHRGGMREVDSTQLDFGGLVTEVPRPVDDGRAVRRLTEERRPATRPETASDRIQQRIDESAEPQQARPRKPDRRTPYRSPESASRERVYAGASPAHGRDGRNDAGRFTRRMPPIAAPESITSGRSAGADRERTTQLASPEPMNDVAETTREPLAPPEPQHRMTDLSTPEAVMAAVEAGHPADEDRQESRMPRSSEQKRSESTPAVETLERTLPPRVEEGAAYTVRPGDTLTRVARDHYGSADRAIVRAIYEANQSVMASPDQLVAGRQIQLPVIGRLATAKTDREASTPVRDNRSGREQVARVVAQPAVEYRIKPGDTLSRIAKAQYGTSSRAVIRAIYEANRDMMASPDRIVVGRTISLPPPSDAALASGGRVAGAPSTFAAASGTSPKQESKRERKERSPKVRWYKLKKGDMYSTVAAEQLGTSKRWPELVELNRDIFPDPSRIRYGVEIRIPIDPNDVSSIGPRGRSAG